MVELFPSLSRRAVPGRIADVCLWLLIIVAPIAGGSSDRRLLPVLGAIAIVGSVAVIVSHERQQRSLHLTGLSVALFLLSCVTLLQAVPLPRGWVSLLSPRLVELQQFVDPEHPFEPLSVSYEIGATLAEATKLLIYSSVALIAHERVRAKHAYEVVALPVVVAGISAAVLALVHRALGLHRLMGVLPTRATQAELFTTFANANHSAGFMALTCLTAIGLALDDRARHRRIGFLAVAAVAGAVCVLTLSRGGIGALFVGVLLFGLLLLRFRGNKLRFASSGMVTAALLLPLAGVVVYAEQILGQFIGRDGRTIGLEEKLAAMKDAVPLIEGHPLFGIGRGAYISVYPHYKTSLLQLTFAYPENIAIQLLSEWGLLVGGLALLGLLWAVGSRLVRAASVGQLGALVGVAALLVQNVVDFSLELPGVAIPVVALLGAVGPRLRKDGDEDPAKPEVDPGARFRIKVQGPIIPRLMYTIPASLLLLLCTLTLGSRDVYADLRQLEATAKTADHGPVDLVEAQEILEAHPANPYVSALYAYLAETQDPPDLSRAIRWVNRTLYLAPTYADGHLQAGRLLIAAEQRRQGFEAMRRAWELSPGDRRTMFITQIVSLARSSREVRRAIPRRVPALDVLDEGQVDRVIQILVARGQAEWARRILRSVNLDVVADEAYWRWANDAFALQEFEIAKDAVERMRAKDPDHQEALRLHARVLYALGDAPGAKALLDGALAKYAGKAAPSLLRFRFQLAVEDADEDLSRRLLHEIRTHTVATPNGQVEVARLEAQLERRLGHFVKALQALDTAITVMPSDTRLRLDRARLLRRIGRIVDARRDVEVYIERVPGDEAAQTFLAQLKEDEVKAVGESRRRDLSAAAEDEADSALLSHEILGQPRAPRGRDRRSPEPDGEPALE